MKTSDPLVEYLKAKADRSSKVPAISVLAIEDDEAYHFSGRPDLELQRKL